MKYYKTLFNNKSCNGGKTTFIKNKWTEEKRNLEMCSSGYHLTSNPFKWLNDANQIWEAKHKGKVIFEDDSDKIC